MSEKSIAAPHLHFAFFPAKESGAFPVAPQPAHVKGMGMALRFKEYPIPTDLGGKPPFSYETEARIRLQESAGPAVYRAGIPARIACGKEVYIA